VTILKQLSPKQKEEHGFCSGLLKTDRLPEANCCQGLGVPLTALPKELKGFREVNPEPEVLQRVIHQVGVLPLSEVEETTSANISF